MRGLFLAWAISFQLIAIAQTSDKGVTSFKIIPEILVKPIMGVMRISRDTIEFKIGNHLDPATVKVEDLFNHLIGFQVTEEGRIFYNGKEIEAILIDGEPVAVFDYRHIAKHLNAKMFSSVELIKHYQSNRFDHDFISNDAVAVNLKMKREFGNKINADIGLELGTPNGWMGKTDISRLGARLKSIAGFSKNANAERVLFSLADVSHVKSGVQHPSDLVLHPLAAQGLPFKKNYLSNNASDQLQSTFSIRIGSCQQLNVALDRISIDQNFSQSQQTVFNSGVSFSRSEKRSTALSQFQSSRIFKIQYVHDRLKNNRGEYMIYLGDQRLREILYDTVSLVSSWTNRGLSSQSRNSIYFSGGEKLRIFNKYVLKYSIEASSNKFRRSIEDMLVKSNHLHFVQDFILSELSSSFRIRNNVFQSGIRFLTEQRGMNGLLHKRYAFAEHQSRMGRKFQFQTEAAFGSAHLMLKGDSYRDFIHQLKGQLIYTKSMFNLIHLQYLSRRTIPEIDIWMTEALYQAYGRFQYLIPPTDFLLTRKIEIGKSYHNVYTGLQYRFNSHYQLVNNDIVHRIGFQSYLMTDTMQFNGRNRSFQMLGEGSIFLHAYKVRLSAHYQFTSSSYLQAFMGEAMPIRMINQSVKITAKTVWQKLFHADLSITANQSLSVAGLAKNQFMLFHHRLNLKYKSWERGLAGLQYQLIQPLQGRLYSFMDIFLQIQPSETFKVKLSGLNLMDVRRYQQQYIIGYGVQHVSTYLQGRNWQIECSIHF
ncbi:MAG: hypothetical protein LW706_00375 [Chitinophagaceae bacterium]|nr:hypothetical protein [Chitinophagaceae bacterium]